MRLFDSSNIIDENREKLLKLYSNLSNGQNAYRNVRNKYFENNHKLDKNGNMILSNDKNNINNDIKMVK